MMRIAEARSGAVATLRLVVYGNGDARQLSGRGHPLLEFDRSEHPFRQAVLTPPIEHLAGVVAIPAAPGLSIEVDRASIERFTTGDRCGEAR